MGNIITTILILFVLLLNCLLGFTACSESKEEIQTTTQSVENPVLSIYEAIGLAKQNAIDYPNWAGNTQLASLYVNSYVWNAEYSDDGKWNVELRFSSEDGGSFIIYRWSVIESDLTAIYVGKYSEKKPDISSMLSEEQVIKIIQDNGLQMCSSDGIVKPIGEWTAVLDKDSNGVWLITGNVEITESGFIFQAIAQWRYNGYTIFLKTLLK